jgi:hypothetical protein
MHFGLFEKLVDVAILRQLAALTRVCMLNVSRVESSYQVTQIRLEALQLD